MPSKSKAEKRTMAAIAHGWKPPKGSSVADITPKVAQDFFEADKKAGNRNLPERKGGKK